MFLDKSLKINPLILCNNGDLDRTRTCYLKINKSKYNHTYRPGIIGLKVSAFFKLFCWFRNIILGRNLYVGRLIGVDILRIMILRK